MEWENQFELKVSKYISANIFLYPRFDDSNARDDDMGYFQFQEYSSLGLAYKFWVTDWTDLADFNWFKNVKVAKKRAQNDTYII